MWLLSNAYLSVVLLSNTYLSVVLNLCGLFSIPESHVGMAWRLKNEIPNSHILDQVSLYAHDVKYRIAIGISFLLISHLSLMSSSSSLPLSFLPLSQCSVAFWYSGTLLNDHPDERLPCLWQTLTLVSTASPFGIVLKKPCFVATSLLYIMDSIRSPNCTQTILNDPV